MTLRGVGHAFGGRHALHPIDLDLERGSLLVVRGANGSGKSTLLRIIAGLLRPTTGSRACPGTAILLAPGDGARRRDRVCTAVQSAAAVSGGEVPGGVAHLLEQVHLPASIGGQRVEELSSGQRGRLTLALALVVVADLVCLDEPSAHLDAAGAQVVADVVARLRAAGRTVVVATHDRVTAPADGVITLEGGRVVEAVV